MNVSQKFEILQWFRRLSRCLDKACGLLNSGTRKPSSLRPSRHNLSGCCLCYQFGNKPTIRTRTVPRESLSLSERYHQTASCAKANDIPGGINTINLIGLRTSKLEVRTEIDFLFCLRLNTFKLFRNLPFQLKPNGGLESFRVVGTSCLEKCRKNHKKTRIVTGTFTEPFQRVKRLLNDLCLHCRQSVCGMVEKS